MSVEVCRCVWGRSEAFKVCVGVCGCFPLDRNQADLAMVGSYGVLHVKIMWACLWRSTCMCVGVSGTFGSVWVCGCFPHDRNQADLAVVWSYGMVLHQNIM